LFPAHVAARAAGSVSVDADADIPVFCAADFSVTPGLCFAGCGLSWLPRRGQRCPIGGSPFLPGREVRHYLLNVLHLRQDRRCGPRTRARAVWLAAGGHVRASDGCDPSPRRAVPGWPRWPGLPGACPAGQGPGSPSSGSRPVTTMRLRPGWAQLPGPRAGTADQSRSPWLSGRDRPWTLARVQGAAGVPRGPGRGCVT